ncbi:MAG: HAD-IA family hydrolase [Acetobacteraceae bacterium]|nr:HAD-IA family hydrolase [Acetobacteraceae bacterium]
MQRPEAIAFDVIGTLFSLEPLRGALEAAGIPGDAFEALFAATLRDAFALAATGVFQPLQAVLSANLDALFRRYGVLLKASYRKTVLAAMKKLPSYPDAAQALGALSSANIPVLALSNDSAKATEALLRRARLHNTIKLVISVEEVGVAMPRCEVYLLAASRAGIEPSRLALVATHAWDVHGAKAAGLIAAFVARGQAFPPIMMEPDVQGETLAEVAGKLARAA